MLEPGHLPEKKRTINTFVLMMISLAVVISLRNLPLTAEYGYSAIYYFSIAVLCFMLPYALISAELASSFPKSGGVFVWVKEAMGTRWGFFAIWMQWFHNMTWYPAMLAFIAAGIAQLINPALSENKIYLLCIILGGFWGATFLNFLGIRTSSFISTLCVILGVIIPGALLIGLGAYWVFSGAPLSITFRGPNLVPDLSEFSNLVFLGGIFLAMSGLEVNANIAREVKHPQKTYPKAILGAALLTICILIMGSLSIAFVIPKAKISLVSGLWDAFRHFFAIYNLKWLTPIISLFVVLGAFGELNAWAIAGAKGLFVTTEYGCLPPVFHKLNKHHTPVNVMILQAVVVSFASLLFLFLPNLNAAYWVLSALSSQMYLLMYILLLASGIILRYIKPHAHRPYRVPFGNFGIWLIGVVGICACCFSIVMSFIPPRFLFSLTTPLKYELSMILGFTFIFCIPLVIYALRKPHWKIEILKEIQEEIHRSTH